MSSHQPQPTPSPSPSPRSPHHLHPSVRRSRTNPISIYASPAYKPSTTPTTTPPASPRHACAASYGVYVDAPSDAPANALRTHVSEPLQSPHQSRRAASIAALAHAIRLSHSLPAHPVEIVLDDKDVADHFNGHANSWRDRVKARRADNVWRPVADLVAEHGDHPVVLHVRSATHALSSPVRKAKELALQAMGKHAFCRLCHRNYGRAGAVHECHPTCSTPPCHGVRFQSVQEYERHVEERHPIAVVFPEDGKLVVASPKKDTTCPDENSADNIEVLTCPSCKAPFVDLAAFEAHIEKECPEALAHWYSQTTIVKD
ncbi:unnamed protein product [Chondrus crispus]|uniref:Uncharacterized protein n=1 Tax=Chondrus crispus TaxID=2769 RepID=R7Q9S5_CHOCR|nr:unnamed protein product [Chondrus crispus]CDF34230.1 unnamed protein product [Chondrus crispus]|eukprot:XP_005714049.1 unnamed protein product [Chondrus crispus]